MDLKQLKELELAYASALSFCRPDQFITRMNELTYLTAKTLIEVIKDEQLTGDKDE